MGINLSCGQIGVTQKQLHDSQIGAVIEQVRRKSMPQGVR